MLCVVNTAILCLQETWTIDSNINILGNIHKDFLFTGISGVEPVSG